MSDKEAIQTIKDRINLVDLVGRSVKLRKSGNTEWTGCCPFHVERTPSFYVVPNKQIWHCFGCGETGDAIDFVMKTESLPFPEALEQLAKEAGVDLPKRERVDTREEQRLNRLRAILDESQAFFKAQLVSEEDAMAYLQTRGLTSGFIELSGLGVAPPTFDMLVRHLKSVGFKGEDIVAAGVGAVSQRGGLIDTMRNRITIPIIDWRGRLVAFGGRVLDDSKPKYLNTKETDLFKKGETLFGLFSAKGNMQDGALVVEGYFDVLTLQMLSIPNAVAPLGTALTEAHLDRLKRYTERIILCFDGDEAGHRAMEKTLTLALPKGFDVRLLELPQGEDPDTWAMSVGKAAFEELMRKAPDWTAFKLQRAMQGRDMRKVAERMAVLKEITPMVGYLPQDTRELFVATLSHQLQLPAFEVAKAAGIAPSTPEKPVAEPEAPKATPEPQNVSKAILGLTVLWLDVSTRQVVLDAPKGWWEDCPGACYLEEILDDGKGEVSTEAKTLLWQAAAMKNVGRVPNSERLLLSLETDYIESELQALRRGMDDPKTPRESLPTYEKAQLALLERRSRLNRRHGRLEGHAMR